MTVDVETAALDGSDRPAPPTSPWMTVLFAITSLVGAGLLFVVQPLVARLVLPHFGGSATVWSTSSLFFQVLLLLGYLYTHLATRRLGRRSQPLLHLAVLLLPLAALPVALPEDLRPDPSSSPVLWLLITLAMMVGLPFVVISTTGPLLQRWYSWTVNRRADDPYFLFATSNLGSFGGLLAYPFLVEPFLTVEQQRVWWSWGFAGFVLLMALCGVVAYLGGRSASSADALGPRLDPAEHVESDVMAQSRVGPPASPTARTVMVWLALSFLPSTLMLGVTAHISTDVAAIPLMWVVPLAIYLATFVVAFARQTRTLDPTWFRLSALFATAAAVVFVMGSGLPIWVVIGIDLGLLATAAFVAHARLASLRPDPSHLTTFYLVVASGGAMGGLLNGLIAPVLFNWVWEYPLAVVVVALLGLGHGRPVSRLVDRRYHPWFVLLLESTSVLLLMGATVAAVVRLKSTPLILVAAVVVLLLLGWLAVRRPAPVAVAIALVMTLPVFLGDPVIQRDRTFYGSYTVREADGVRVFTHGTTLHGQQSLGEDSGEPRTYYARSGPVGSALDVLDNPASIGVVGLGVGTIAAYGQPGQRMAFFEIDPEVVEVASNPDLFTYLSTSPADIEHIVGDGRLTLAEQSPGSFDVIFLDAFTSDAIPVHLLTTEAFDTYDRALADGGLLMVHISNRVFDLEPVVASAADQLGWEALVGFVEADEQTGGTPTQWVALTSDPTLLQALQDDDQMWRTPGERRVTWTDDYSSVLRVLR
ncbi:fused MFS/spermidine synthase [Ornithinimicrobium sp. W1679]|uniref:fused MFS/spermidine synthase n=1 Tax=Ornithinimicrobium sp. W1679 TaxID=3418770 RepID=UPI003CE8B697